MSDVSTPAERRVLLLAPTARDAAITESFLKAAGLDCCVCPSVASLTEQMRIGAGAVLMTEEAITAQGLNSLIELLDAQPPWSDLPLVMLMRGGVQSREASRVLQSLRNVTLLDRPTSSRSVVSAVNAAVRARDRQYLAREQFKQLATGEARYRLLQQELAMAIEASQVGTFHCDMPLSKIIWNDVCKAHFWLPPEAEINFDVFYSIVHPDDRERTRQAVDRCVYERQPYDIEYRTVSPTGQVRWIRATGRTFYDDSGAPIRFDGTTQDVTDKRNAAEEREQLLESERHARAESERNGHMKDEFLATLSHELRTPLNAILGWSQLIREETDPEGIREGLEVIERNARVQVQLIEDLLDMSRIISGKVRLDVRSIDPAGFIDAAIDTVAPAATARGVRVTKVLDPRAGPISGDPGRLQQVVWNLLSNAIKFTPKNGKVQVVLQRVNSHIEISVSDTGQGIAPEFLPHVFERFRQADSSSTRMHGGLGLGLAIVRHLIEMHGGTIAVSSPGHGMGSTFTIKLPVIIHDLSHDEPRVHPRVSQSSGYRSDATMLRGLNVVVVDDEPDARNLVKRVLEECGAKVASGSSAKEALSLVETNTPDLLLSDIGMPGTDGYELLRRVRQLHPEHGGHTPAIALTAFARTEDRTRALLAGYAAHLSKPVEPRELIATILRVAERGTVSGRTRT